MDAKKCDRCGKFFMSSEVKSKFTIVENYPPDEDTTIDYDLVDIDIKDTCPDCAEQINVWFSNPKLKKFIKVKKKKEGKNNNWTDAQRKAHGVKQSKRMRLVRKIREKSPNMTFKQPFKLASNILLKDEYKSPIGKLIDSYVPCAPIPLTKKELKANKQSKKNKRKDDLIKIIRERHDISHKKAEEAADKLLEMYDDDVNVKKMNLKPILNLVKGIKDFGKEEVHICVMCEKREVPHKHEWCEQCTENYRKGKL